MYIAATHSTLTHDRLFLFLSIAAFCFCSLLRQTRCRCVMSMLLLAEKSAPHHRPFTKINNPQRVCVCGSIIQYTSSGLYEGVEEGEDFWDGRGFCLLLQDVYQSPVHLFSGEGDRDTYVVVERDRLHTHLRCTNELFFLLKCVCVCNCSLHKAADNNNFFCFLSRENLFFQRVG